MSKVRLITMLAIALSLSASAAFAGPMYGPQSKEEAARLVAVVKSADADLHAKSEACRNLAVIGSPDIAAELAPMLADEKLSHMIRYALEPIPGPAVDDAFRDAIGKAKGMALVGVVNSIGVRRDAKAVPALVALLKDADEKVACAAAGSLGRIADAPATAALADALASTKDGDLRRAVIDGYLDVAGQLADAGKAADAAAIYTRLRSPDAPSYVRVAATVGLLNCDAAGAGDLIVQALADKDPVVRGTAIARAASAKGADVTTRLAAAIDKQPADTQVLLINALADRKDKAALPALLAATSSQASEVRTAAVAALGKIGDATCVSVLTKALAGEQAQAAADALRLLQDPGVDDAILKAMPASPSAAKVVLIEVLADRKAGGAAAAVLAQADSDDPAVKLAAIKSLGRGLGAPGDLPALIKILTAADADGVRSEAIRTVVAVSRKVPNPADQADAVLAALAAAKTPAARTALIEAVGGIGGTKAFNAVKASLADSDPAVKDAAIRALAAWPDAAAVEPMLELLAKTADNTHRVLLLRGAIRLLGAAGKPAAQTVEIYKGLLEKAKNPADKKLILAGLAGVYDPAALAVVEPLLAEKDVQAEAELAAIAIAGRIMGANRDLAESAARKVLRQTANDGAKRQAQSILNRLRKFGDYVTAWQYAGPYSMEGKGAADLFELALAPEKPQAEKDVKWTPIAPSGLRDAPWMFDLGDGSQQACYVRTFIRSDEAQPARIQFGTDDGCKLWLNGKQVFADGQPGPAVPDEHKVDVQLNKGWNVVLLKVVQDTGPWQFCFRVTAPGGGAIAGLRTSATPPAE